MTSRTRFGMAALAIGVLGLVAPALAGDLNPPAGAVSPTMKDLDDVEPRGVIRNNPDGITPIVISQPGSYKLGENIQAIGNEHGIEIAVSRVTLDLNGFEIVGSEIGSLNGIEVADNTENVTIRNGRIRLFTGAAIAGAVSDRMRVEGVDCNDTFAGGVVCGDNAFIDRCTATGVTIAFATGISAGDDSRVTNCSVDGCYTGVFANSGSQVTGCRASGSTFAGFYLLGVISIKDCVAVGTSSVTQHGIYADGFGGGEISGNTITEFSTAGIRAVGTTQINGNLIHGSQFGGDLGLIITGSRNFIYENTIFDCSSGMDLNNFCEQEVYANRLQNVGALAINNCAFPAPEESPDTSTNPHANLR
ncbi:MAG: right-handed parallel beta-helix repeat-containing protein [Phycisphaeraceae bacterium]|nr:right-handed parallel beta-helix repeat-containing protein [Phycisphaeraceae bacterium]